MKRLFLYIILIALAAINTTSDSCYAQLFCLRQNIGYSGEVLGATAETQTDKLSYPPLYKTETAFEQTEIEEEETIPYEVEYIEDPDMEYGKEEILTKGVEGTTVYKYLLTHWQGETIDKQLVDTTTYNPSKEVVAKGTKIVWKLLSTPDLGRVKYWQKLEVWATKYDANCPGCTGRTYSGTDVKKGVCATDPKVIPLGTNFYVPGYGLCRAEDIGGAIKGNKIDLGYKDASKGDWITGPAEVYLLTNAPE